MGINPSKASGCRGGVVRVRAGLNGPQSRCVVRVPSKRSGTHKGVGSRWSDRARVPGVGASAVGRSVAGSVMLREGGVPVRGRPPRIRFDGRCT